MNNKFKFEALSVIAIILIGCSNDDENIETEKSIIGN